MLDLTMLRRLFCAGTLALAAMLLNSAVAQDTPPRAIMLSDDARYERNSTIALGMQNKIAGGKHVDVGTFTDVVGLGILAPDNRAPTLLCTGLLVSARTALSAKHCVCDPTYGRYINVAVVGYTAKSADRFRIVSTIPSGSDCQKGIPNQALDLDIALFILDKAVPDFKPRLYADAKQIDAAKSFRIVGFGIAPIVRGGQFAGYAFGDKLHTVVPSATNDCAGQVVTREDGTFSDTDAWGCKQGLEIVAGALGLGRDTCKGDSGGPILVGPTGVGDWEIAEDKLVLAGITSRSTRTKTGQSGASRTPCGDGGIYVRLATDVITQWINQNSVQ